MSLLPFNFIAEGSEATPGLWNSPLSILSANIAGVAANQGSGLTFSALSDISTGGGVFTAAPSNLSGAVTIHANSNVTDYLAFTDSSNARSNYLFGSHAGGTADGLNIYDASGSTMIVSFSKQSVRFYQNVVGPVFDVGGALASTYNAATFGAATDSIESRIQAAISAAILAGVVRVYVPSNMYPYSGASVSFDTRIQMVREGGDQTIYDVIAYGGNGNGSTGSAAANTNAIRSAMSAANADPANTGLGGGVVYFPNGRYVFNPPLVVPMTTNQGQVTLRGVNMRTSVLFPAFSVTTSLIFGSPVPDNSGSVVSETQYCGLEDIGITGSLTTTTTCAIQWTEMQKGWMRNVIIQTFKQPGSIGLYLRGSTTAGLGASAPPHSWRGGFQNLIVSTTYRPLVIENGDENDFFNCNFNTPTGITSATTAIQIIQGRNNRFFGLLAGGDSSSITTGRPNYTGILLGPAVNGDIGGNQFYGVVTEGFDSGFSIGASVYNTTILFHNSSINSVNIKNAGTGTLYYETDGLVTPLYQHPDGSAAGPAFAFLSEGSLGWYRSATSTMALAPTGRLLVGTSAAFSLTTQPEYGFGGETDLGMRRSGASTLGFWSNNLRLGQFTGAGGVGSLWVEVGSSSSPGVAFTSEPKLGFYRSSASNIAQSYGTFSAPAIAGGSGAVLTPSLTFTSARSAGLFDAGSQILGIVGVGTVGAYVYSNQVVWNASGTAVLPSQGWQSERSLGVYRSGVSTMALSYGTLNLATQSVRLSMRTLAASSVTASAAKTNVAVDEVVFTIGGASGASLIIYSGGTAYGFNSAFSAAAS